MYALELHMLFFPDKCTCAYFIYSEWLPVLKFLFDQWLYGIIPWSYWQIADKRVSRNHAVLEVEDGKLKLMPVSKRAEIDTQPVNNIP